MERIEYHYEDVDKTAWGEGEWLTEPDKVQWQDKETGLPCIAKRNEHFGFWCGYVGVTRGHHAYGKHYDEVNVVAHGGLTFADRCQPHEDTEQGEAHAICHVVQDGENDDVWWLGFDCGHYMDDMPGTRATLNALGGEVIRSDFGVYRTISYVEAEIKHLAAQLHAQKGFRYRLREALKLP